MTYIIMILLSFFSMENLVLAQDDPITINVDIEYGQGYYCLGVRRLCSITEGDIRENSATVTINGDGSFSLKIPIDNERASQSHLSQLQTIQLDKPAYLEFEKAKISINIPKGEYTVMRSEKYYEILFD